VRRLDGLITAGPCATGLSLVFLVFLGVSSAPSFRNTPYDGQPFDLLFPLNTDSSAALVLGKKSDDQLSPPDELLSGQEQYFFATSNYGFDAVAKKTGSGFTLLWTYEFPSLRRAVERRVLESRVYAGLPEEFSFVVAAKDLHRVEYLDRPARHFRDTVEAPTDKSPWFVCSQIRVYVNGQSRPSYVYTVTRGEPKVEYLRLSMYDDPEPLFVYTVFHCKLNLLR
jgi:hypothetical protein